MYVLFHERSSLHPYFMKDHHYILQDQYLFLSVHLSHTEINLRVLSYGDQNVHFFDVTPYIIFTHLVFLHLY